MLTDRKTEKQALQQPGPGLQIEVGSQLIACKLDNQPRPTAMNRHYSSPSSILIRVSNQPMPPVQQGTGKGGLLIGDGRLPSWLLLVDDPGDCIARPIEPNLAPRTSCTPACATKLSCSSLAADCKFEISSLSSFHAQSSLSQQGFQDAFAGFGRRSCSKRHGGQGAAAAGGGAASRLRSFLRVSFALHSPPPPARSPILRSHSACAWPVCEISSPPAPTLPRCLRLGDLANCV